MADETVVFHVAVDLLRAEHHHFLGHKAPEGCFEGGPFGIDHRVLHAGLEYPLAHGGKVAIIAFPLQLLGSMRCGQKGIHGLVRFKALSYCVVKPAVAKGHTCLISMSSHWREYSLAHG